MTEREALDAPRRSAASGALVNNAGINPYYHPVIETPLSEWDEVLRVNLLGAAAFARAVGRALADAGGGGRIVNLCSIAGLTGLPNIGPYNASKAALDALTRTLAVELGPAGVLCNSIAPGTIATEMVDGLMTANPALKERSSPRRRSGASGRVAEAAWPIVFLLTDAASFITGQTLVVDGGRLAAGLEPAVRIVDLRGRHGRLRRSPPACPRIRRYEVTLLEVGPHYRPGRWPAELAHSHRIIKETHDWGYLARAGASPRLVHVPRGRVVGGSSVTNGAIALRGHPEHYDEWAGYVDGWGWETWLPWFRAIERDRDFPRGRPGTAPRARSRSAATRAQSWLRAPGALRRGRPRRRPPLRSTTTTPRARSGIGRSRSTWSTACARPRPTATWTRPSGGTTCDWRPAWWSTGCVLEDGRARRGRGARTGPGARPAGRPTRSSWPSAPTPARPALLRSGVGPRGRARAATASRWPPRCAGVGRGMQDHPKISYRFDLVGLEAPALAGALVPGAS